MSTALQDLPIPVGLLAELTHRCPLACPYCSNPLRLDSRASELDSATWARVFSEAAALGVVHVHLSGGEPAARRDLTEIVGSAHAAGLYCNLITSGIGLMPRTLAMLAEAGLDHVQLSVQHSRDNLADEIAGYVGAARRKRELASTIVQLGLALTINMVVHRDNIDSIDEVVAMAASLGAARVEIAHTQYYGWAFKNRSRLLPSRGQVMQALTTVERLRDRYRGRLVIDSVPPDYFARYPKPCVGGWGRRSLNVTPSGKVLPCHAAELLPNLEFWTVHEHSLTEIWAGPAFEAFRGTAWMQAPCRTCPKREVDFGGCRCQAFMLTQDARAADPVCHLSSHHSIIEQAQALSAQAYHYRGR